MGMAHDREPFRPQEVDTVDADHSAGPGESPSRREALISDDLDAANALLRDGAQVGNVGPYCAPFSRQLKSEIRRLFPRVVTPFDDADRTLRRVRGEFLWLKALTLLTFLTFLGVTYGLAIAYVAPEQFSWFPGLADLAPIWRLVFALVLMVLAATALFGARTGLREVFFRALINPSMRDFTHRFASTYMDALVAAMTRAQESRDSAGPGPWARRAYERMKVALYHAKRAEYIDRYGTTTLWNIRDLFKRIEYASWILKIATGFATTAFILLMSDPAATALAGRPPGSMAGRLVLVTLLAILGLWLWGFVRRKDDYLTEVFGGEFAAARAQRTIDEAEISYLEQIPDVVQNLVAETLMHARSGGRSS